MSVTQFDVIYPERGYAVCLYGWPWFYCLCMPCLGIDEFSYWVQASDGLLCTAHKGMILWLPMQRHTKNPPLPGSWGPWDSQVVLVVKNPSANARDIRDTGLIPGSERSPGGGHGNPFQYSCLENPMDRGGWWLQSIGLQRVRHDWSNLAHLHRDAIMNKKFPFHCFPICYLRQILILRSGKKRLIQQKNMMSSETAEAK